MKKMFKKIFGRGTSPDIGPQPRDRTIIRHRAAALPEGKVIRFRHILIVEDNVDEAISLVKAIKLHYTAGAVTILIAFAHAAAVELFSEFECNLVIMDKDLKDEHGDGVLLTEEFLKQKPGLTILANSSDYNFNRELVAAGATGVIGKSPRQLRNWLWSHDNLWQ